MIELDKNRSITDFFKFACRTCEHYHYDNICEAFKGGIPEDILTGENQHKEKHPKQKNDILFEPIITEFK